MGLDVTAYQQVEFVAPATPEQEEMEQDDQGWPLVKLLPDTEFVERMDTLTPGFYRVSGTSFGFRAGSYVWYGGWREWLANQVGASFWKRTSMAWAHPTPLQPIQKIHAFYELVWFSDCEGCIGPETCRKLAADFVYYDNKVQGDEQQMRVYRNFEKAFVLAAGSGAVSFH